MFTFSRPVFAFLSSPRLPLGLSPLCGFVPVLSLSSLRSSLLLSPLSAPHSISLSPLFAPPVVCFDAKINFDDNAQFRQKAVFAMDDNAESDPTETEAAKWDLKYIGLDGNIACFGQWCM